MCDVDADDVEGESERECERERECVCVRERESSETMRIPSIVDLHVHTQHWVKSFSVERETATGK